MAIWIKPGIPFAPDEERVDAQGRYILLRGRLDGQPIVLGSLYFPNVDQHQFLVVLTRVFADWVQLPRIIGGDFNTVLNTELDRSHHPLPSSSVVKNANALVQ